MCPASHGHGEPRAFPHCCGEVEDLERGVPELGDPLGPPARGWLEREGWEQGGRLVLSL